MAHFEKGYISNEEDNSLDAIAKNRTRYYNHLPLLLKESPKQNPCDYVLKNMHELSTHKLMA